MAKISEKERQRILRNWTETLDKDSMGCAGSIYYCLKDSRREIKESLGKERYKKLIKTAEYVSDRCNWDMDDDEFSDLREKLEYIADVGRETMFGFSGKEGVEYALSLHRQDKKDERKDEEPRQDHEGRLPDIGRRRAQEKGEDCKCLRPFSFLSLF